MRQSPTLAIFDWGWDSCKPGWGLRLSFHFDCEMESGDSPAAAGGEYSDSGGNPE